MDNQTTPTVPEVTPGDDAPTMGFVQRLTGVYFEPSKTFEDINRKPTWLTIYILMSLLAVASFYVLTIRMDYETYMRKSIEMSPASRLLSEEQIEEAVSRPPSAFQRYSGMAFAPAGMIVVYLAFAGIFLLLFTLMGASLSYKKSLAVSFWAMAPPGIIVTLLGILFMYLRDPATLELNPANNVASNLGPLVSSGDSPVIHGLLSSIDVFSFWTIFLLSVGFAAISDRRLTTKKAATGIFMLWGAYVLLKAGYHAVHG
ncbi:MAG: YIP1 family protein [Deltaproteobacteria bacterium]|nr:YIP1 family protein [Deltaproteobacteria bacterium]